jgi:hypothetical protein
MTVWTPTFLPRLLIGGWFMGVGVGVGVGRQPSVTKGCLLCLSCRRNLRLVRTGLTAAIAAFPRAAMPVPARLFLGGISASTQAPFSIQPTACPWPCARSAPILPKQASKRASKQASKRAGRQRRPAGMHSRPTVPPVPSHYYYSTSCSRLTPHSVNNPSVPPSLTSSAHSRLSSP